MLEHVQNVLTRLTGVRPTGTDKWEARCPSHDDQHASLSIGLAETDKRVLLHCHAGCNNIAITRAIGLKLRDLFAAGDPHRERKKPSRVVATYDYRDTTGAIVYRVLRYEPKSFRQQRADGTWSMDGVTRVLFRLPELVKASPSAWVYVVEGEKDVLALEAAGLVATCNPGGACKWSMLGDDSILTGRRVCIIADADSRGREHAKDVAGRLFGRASDVRIIELPGSKDAADWLAAGGTPDRLAEIRDAAKPYEPGLETSRARILVHGKQLREVADETLAAIGAANDPPTVFVRGGQLTRIVYDELGNPQIEAFSVPHVRLAAMKAADWYTLNRDGEEIPTQPSRSLLESVLSRGEWELPALSGFTRAPILRRDGTICTLPGYDGATGLYYAPQPGLVLPPIPDHPTPRDAADAMGELLNVIGGFPFASEPSRTGAMALLFTLIMRPVLDGNIPLCVIDAPVQGTGKSLLANTLGKIAVGHVAAESVPTKDDDDEWRKKITSVLLRGTQFVLLDNLPDGTSLRSPAIASVLTTRVWSDRKLHHSETVTLPASAVWAATGNNLRIEGDLTRRCYLIRLDANCERPWQRDGFAIANLDAYVDEHRAELLVAALTVVRGWYMAGCPRVSVPKLGSFDPWAETIGSVLDFAGCVDFLGNLRDITQVKDDEGQQWEQLMNAWAYEFGSGWVYTDDVCSRLCVQQYEHALTDGILMAMERGRGSLRKTVGRLLAKLDGRVISGRKFRSAMDQHRKVRIWILEGDVTDATNATDAVRGLRV